MSVLFRAQIMYAEYLEIFMTERPDNVLLSKKLRFIDAYTVSKLSHPDIRK